MRGSTTRDTNAMLLCQQQAAIASLEDHVKRLLVVLSQRSGVSLHVPCTVLSPPFLVQ